MIFPILPTIKQFPDPKSILLQHKENLLPQPYQLSHHIQLPIILQIPPTPPLPHLFPKQLHFFSIRTNDLIQYTLPP
ncbi:putative PEP-binding protein, partial [Staphylococcus epidermidis]|uniref:putative PEP-binding protein n=1 Tax=Staphylococcus epidermidis TaxID=1282 RepID=UPI0037D99174